MKDKRYSAVKKPPSTITLKHLKSGGRQAARAFNRNRRLAKLVLK